MKSTTLELFWIEKIKLVQTTINNTKFLSDDELFIPLEKNHQPISKQIEHMVQNDKKFVFYLPLFMKMSQFIPFSAIDSAEIEKELTSIRDMYNTPGLPPDLSSIIARYSEDLDTEDSNPKLDDLWNQWRGSLRQIEDLLGKKNEDQILKLRYFTLRGIYSIPSMVNMTAMHNYHHLITGILEDLKKIRSSQ